MKHRAFPKFLFLLFCASTSESLFSQQKVMTAQSVLDWRSTSINSVVSLDIEKAGISLPAGRNSALLLLEMEMPALLKDTLFSIIVDSKDRLGHAVARGTISLSDLNNQIDSGKKTPPYFSKDLSSISMTHKVSVSAIGTLFINHTKAYTPLIPLQSVASRPYTGIVIDARKSLAVQGEYTEAELVPCLFPKIWNEDMDLLYEKNSVDPNIAKNNGIVRYSDSTNLQDYSSIVGTDPLRITARKVFGTHRTDPIISTNDYLKIMSVPENRDLLRQGKVVILCASNQLETQKLGPEKNNDYYFVWNEISNLLAKKPIKQIDFSDSWEGIKFTMYDVRFIADSDQLLAEEKDRLDNIAKAMSLAGPNAHFIIEGHTASVGKPSGEQLLSVQRAQRIAEELSKRGLSLEKITAQGYGGTRPVADNSTDQGRALNRRVEILVQTE